MTISWLFNTLSATPPFPSIHGPEGFLPWLFYTILCIVADIVHDICGPGMRPPTASSSSIDNMNDDEFLKICDRSLCVPNFDSDPVNHRLPILNHDIVYKWIQPSDHTRDTEEANAQILVYEKTTIPVPRIRRIVKDKYGYSTYFIIMDYIKGPTLANVWGSMSFWRKMKVAWTLRGYVRQLRRLKAPSGAPGPISCYGPSKCNTLVISDRDRPRGPFASSADLSRFFKQRVRMTLKAHPELPADDLVRTTKLDDLSEPLVLNHLDINPRNIIVGEDGRLWLIDFAYAGYYPPWFEYVSTLVQCWNEHTLKYDMKDWKMFVPFICGPYFKQEVWRRGIGRALTYR